MFDSVPPMFCLFWIPILVCLFLPPIGGMWLERYVSRFVFLQSIIRHWHKLGCAGLMTDLLHTNLCQRWTLIWLRNSYDTQLLCLFRLLSIGHDWVFTFSVGVHTFSTKMFTSWELFDNNKPKWLIWCFENHLSKGLCVHFLLWAHVYFWNSGLIYQSYVNVVQELKKLNNP